MTLLEVYDDLAEMVVQIDNNTVPAFSLADRRNKVNLDDIGNGARILKLTSDESGQGNFNNPDNNGQVVIVVWQVIDLMLLASPKSGEGFFTWDPRIAQYMNNYLKALKTFIGSCLIPNDFRLQDSSIVAFADRPYPSGTSTTYAGVEVTLNLQEIVQ